MSFTSKKSPNEKSGPRIFTKVKKTILGHGLFRKKDRILIACSGGVDSTALLHILLDLSQEWSFELFLGHFNHRLRSTADRDERFVRRMAKKYSLPLFVGRQDVRSYARKKKLNIEEAGRELRYRFLKRTAARIGTGKIATGHTMSDQAETFLMRLLRGSGLRGLAGIYPAVEGMVVRPLLEVEREEIENYLKAQGIEFRFDESNLDRRYLRNRIRLELIPYLEENFEPGIVSQLGKIASIIREEDTFLEKLSEREAKKLIMKKGNELFLNAKSLRLLPLALSRRIVRNFLSELRGSLRGVSFEDVEGVLSLGEGKGYPLRRDFVLRRERGWISKSKKTPKIPFEYLWSGKVPLDIEEIHLKFKGKKMGSKSCSRFDFDDCTRVYLNSNKLKFPLCVRNRREGDRYHPLGAPGKKKLKEVFRAKEIPPSERERCPVFLSRGEIVWALGLPVSERFKITRKTNEIFLIEKAWQELAL